MGDIAGGGHAAHDDLRITGGNQRAGELVAVNRGGAGDVEPVLINADARGAADRAEMLDLVGFVMGIQMQGDGVCAALVARAAAAGHIKNAIGAERHMAPAIQAFAIRHDAGMKTRRQDQAVGFSRDSGSSGQRDGNCSKTKRPEHSHSPTWGFCPVSRRHHKA